MGYPRTTTSPLPSFFSKMLNPQQGRELLFFVGLVVFSQRLEEVERGRAHGRFVFEGLVSDAGYGMGVGVVGGPRQEEGSHTAL